MSEKKIYYEVFSIQEFVHDKQIKNRWNNIGSAFPNQDGSFNLSLHLLPLPDPKTGNLKLHMRLPKPKENNPSSSGNYEDVPYQDYSEMPSDQL